MRTEPDIGDGNSPWNEAFGFASIQELRVFQAAHPQLFDRERDAAERARAWKAFARTVAGQKLRWR